MHDAGPNYFGSTRVIHGVGFTPAMCKVSEHSHALVTDYFIVTDMRDVDTRPEGAQGPYMWGSHTIEVIHDFLMANCRGLSEHEWAEYPIPNLLS